MDVGHSLFSSLKNFIAWNTFPLVADSYSPAEEKYSVGKEQPLEAIGTLKGLFFFIDS